VPKTHSSCHLEHRPLAGGAAGCASSGLSARSPRNRDLNRLAAVRRPSCRCSCRLELPAGQERLGGHIEKAGRAHYVLEAEGPPTGRHVGCHRLRREDASLDQVPLPKTTLVKEHADQLRARDVREPLVLLLPLMDEGAEKAQVLLLCR
jgi:hypothetical protein